jgi:succinoglycan biosynthesis protein ExoM
LLESNSEGISGYIKNVFLASAKVVYCGVAALLNVVNPDRMRYWLLRGTLHTGVVSRLFGKREIVQYGDKETT